MRIDHSINPIKTEETKSSKVYPSLSKIITAVALAAIALAAYGVSSQYAQSPVTPSTVRPILNDDIRNILPESDLEDLKEAQKNLRERAAEPPLVPLSRRI